MTAVARARTPGGLDATRARRRIGSLIATEARLLWRFGAIAATAAITAGWALVLVVAPDTVSGALVPVVLLTDVLALGFLLVPALQVLERVERVDDALRVTPVHRAERAGVRIGLTSALSVLAATAVSLASGVTGVPTRVAGATLLAVLCGLIALACTSHAATLTSFLTRAPFIAAPLIAPALVHLAGLSTNRALYLSPVTGGVDLLNGRHSAAGVAWLLVSIVTAAVTADAVTRRPVPAGRPRARRRARRGATRWPPQTGRYAIAMAVRSFARADRRGLLGDGLLAMIAVSVPLLAVAMRLIASVGVTWAAARHGVDLTRYLPLIEALLLVVHTPVMFGSLTGLLLLEDRDAGLFGPLATTRAGLSTLLVYRLGGAAIITGVTLAATMPLDGVAHDAGATGIVATALAAGAVSVVTALLMAAGATSRLQGVAVMKVLGLPLYLPLASWFLDGVAGWAFAPLPTAWLMWTAWATTPAGAISAALVAMLLSVAAVGPLTRRLMRRAHDV